MTPFRDLPIRRKLLVMTLSSSATALVLASAGFLAWDIAQFRNAVEQELTAQVRLIADNSATAIVFFDRDVATETLAVLQERPRVERACLYDASGELFSEYRRATGAASCPSAPPVPSRLDWTDLDIVVPVRSRESRVGSLHVDRDLEDLYARLRVGIVIVGSLLVVSILAAWAIAARMQQSIASPLLQLAETARSVSDTRNYSLRAIPTSRDEVGVVVHAFNEMLDRITERTEALSETNAELEREVEERRKVEAERTAALERERDANRLKDEFLATLSHELRTPLNAVLGWTRVLRAARVEPSTHARALESIERNARAQARLIEDLLEISRIVTGKLRLVVREVDLATLVDSAVEIIRPAAAAKRIRVSVEIAVRPAVSMGDPDRLQQVFWNLLSNAVKFTPPGGEVFVALRDGQDYHLVVRDTGPGIDPQFVPHVFEPFRQADGSPSREHGGLGLGLAIARQLVELHGGTIRVDAGGPHPGATFEVRLPSVVPPQPPGSAASAPAAVLAPPHVDDSLLCRVHVLVVDDEEDARVLLTTALTQYGASVTAVSNVDAAMAAIEDHPPDVLVSDIGMPGQDGYALIRRVRARAASKGGAIPAVAITAYASAEDQRAAEAAGYQGHMAKPFEPDEVAHLVASLARVAHGRSS